MFSGELIITDNTYSIHHFDGSWLSDKDKYSMKKRFVFSKFMSAKLAGLMAEFVAVSRFYGIKNALKETINWFKEKNCGK